MVRLPEISVCQDDKKIADEKDTHIFEMLSGVCALEVKANCRRCSFRTVSTNPEGNHRILTLY